MTNTIPLDRLNAMDDVGFVGALGDIFEHASWVAEAAYSEGPFASVDALHDAMCSIVTAAPAEQRLALIKGHPELAGRAALAGAITKHSTSEQSSAGLDRLSEADLDRFNRLNTAYRERFGFPFIVAVRDHSRESILETFERRVGNDRDTELEEAIRNIMRIARFRLDDLIAS